MNHLLDIKFKFTPEKNPQKPGGRNFRSGDSTSIEKVESLISDLKSVVQFYESKKKIVNDILIDVNYYDVIAKSNRISEILKPSKNDVDCQVVGARFSNAPEGQEKHIITYYVSKSTVEDTIKKLEVVKSYLQDYFPQGANSDNFRSTDPTINYKGYQYPKTRLRNIIVDASVVESFSVPKISSLPSNDSFLITFYKTEVPIPELLEKIGVDRYKLPYDFYGLDTISTSKPLFDYLEEKIPYMISMISSDVAKMTLENITEKKDLPKINIPKPSNEPIIGVIDTFFDDSVYFSEWVDNTDYIDDFEKIIFKKPNREHGTEVTSIIVDGPRMNPWLEDGCGRFKVRHFGVAEERISISRLVRKIKEIVVTNPDIHVWNLSLGTDDEIARNFISYDAAVLDELQAERNIVFVVSGTNDNRIEKDETIRIGSPADSLNSIVVNSVRRNNYPASYSRKGRVLSFFNKPDVSYYGGDYDERLTAYSPTRGDVSDVYGTSFAAPWISRKLCYLIDVIGLTREVAKAMIIDSAAGWDYKNETYKNSAIVGYGVVPISIEKILLSESDEIKFTVYGTSKAYRMANYQIPVPKDKDGKYPFLAKATLCYFPKCSRNQGVDYTNRELSLQFGRIKSEGNIDDINENEQDKANSRLTERQSRREFRKWENTKFISMKVKKRKIAKKSYDDRLWGFAVTSKERPSVSGEELNFGAIITLKELNGINRIEDFIKACTLRSLIVNEIDVENRIDVYNISQEEITFDD